MVAMGLGASREFEGKENATSAIRNTAANQRIRFAGAGVATKLQPTAAV
jgi:hypothetical protein